MGERVAIPLRFEAPFMARVLPFMYGWAVVVAVMGLVFLLILPSRIRFLALAFFSLLGLMMLGVIFIRSVVNDKPYLEFTENMVALRSRAATSEVGWSHASDLLLLRELRGTKARPFPAILVLRSQPAVDPSAFGRVGSVVALQPGGGDWLESEFHYMTELIKRAPARIVDPEVPLLFGLLARLVGPSDETTMPPIRSLDPGDSFVSQVLAAALPEEAPITAPFEYFLGHVEKARAQCEAGLEFEPSAWDLLLCRALCERSLGDEEASRVSLKAALEASPPPEVAPVLMHALEVA